MLAAASAPLSRVERTLCALSAAAPFLFALAHLPSTAAWRADVPLLRAFGFIVGALPGNVSTILEQLLRALPLGPRAFRGALLSAVALAVVGALLFRISLRYLQGLLSRPAAPWLAPIFAMLTSLTATLSAPLQREATVAGGASVAMALLLGTLVVARTPIPSRRDSVLVGILLGALLAETLVGAFALGAVLAVAYRPPRRQWRWLVAGAAVSLTAITLLAFLQGALVMPWGVAVAPQLSPLSDLAWSVVPLASRLSRWRSDIGFLGLALAFAGLAAAFGSPRSRPWATSLLPLVFAGLLAPVPLPDQRTGDAFLPLYPLAVSALAVGAGAAFFLAVSWMLSLSAPFARPTAAIVTLTAVARVALASDDALANGALLTTRGADAWTDEALRRLPPSALVLARSRRLIERLLAAQVVSGARPDVRVVPLPLLGQARLTARLLAEDPALAPLVRDLAVQGTPGEYTLSQLADARPLYMEVDPSCDRRVWHHLVAEHLWHRFQPQPAGASDRRIAQDATQGALGNVLQATREDGGRDEATQAVLIAYAHDQLLLARLLAEHGAAERTETLLSTLQTSPTIAAATLRTPAQK